MQRTAYIYRIIPLMVVLSCGELLNGLLGNIGALIAGLIVVVVTWAIVWLRLYGMRRLRPEFAVLTVLPQAMYFGLKACEPGLIAPHLMPACRNLYFLVWLAAIGVIIFSLRPGYHDDRHPIAQDPMFIMMSIITVAYGATTWANYTASAFPL